MPGDCLCVQCYDELKGANLFKTKVIASCDSRKRLNGEVRNSLSVLKSELESTNKTSIEYEVVITSTSNTGESEEHRENIIHEFNQDDDRKCLPPIAEVNVQEIVDNDDEIREEEIVSPEDILPPQKLQQKKKSRLRVETESQITHKRMRKIKVEERNDDEAVDEKPKDFEIVVAYNMTEKNAAYTIIDPTTGQEMVVTGESSQQFDECSQKKYQCQLCNKRFKSRTTLEGHIRIHTGEKPFKCEICEKCFAEQGNLKQHIRSMHLNIRAFICEKCKQGFKTHYSHQIHRRSCVTKEKPFKCQVCPKAFYSSGKLLLHTRIHTGERPYPCALCSSAFKDNTALKRHTLRVHSTGTKVEQPEPESEEQLVLSN